MSHTVSRTVQTNKLLVTGNALCLVRKLCCTAEMFSSTLFRVSSLETLL